MQHVDTVDHMWILKRFGSSVSTALALSLLILVFGPLSLIGRYVDR